MKKNATLITILILTFCCNTVFSMDQRDLSNLEDIPKHLVTIGSGYLFARKADFSGLHLTCLSGLSEALEQTSRLAVLDASNNQLHNVNEELYQAIRNHPMLNYVILSGNCFTPSTIESIETELERQFPRRRLTVRFDNQRDTTEEGIPAEE